MLREQLGYSRLAVIYFTSAFYIATDVGCLGAGLAVKLLSSRGKTVHTSRMLIFLACGLLTALSMVVAVLPAGPLMLGILLLIGAGSLGLFPIYYSLTQELSTRHQGKLTGLLACTAWIASSLMQKQVGVWVDRTGSYSTILFVAGLLPLASFTALFLLWDSRSDLVPVPERDPEFA
jgi:ACS family hexuronate transporter-like MFS transporter